MAYEIVTAKNKKDLMKKVNYLMSLGNWWIRGGIAFDSKNKDYMQAMENDLPYVQEKKKKKKRSFDQDMINPIEEIPVVVYDGSKEKELTEEEKQEQTEFLKIVDNEMTNEAQFFIYRKYIKSPKKLIEYLGNHWAANEAGLTLISEFQQFIDKYNWGNSK